MHEKSVSMAGVKARSFERSTEPGRGRKDKTKTGAPGSIGSSDKPMHKPKCPKGHTMKVWIEDKAGRALAWSCRICRNVFCGQPKGGKKP